MYRADSRRTTGLGTAGSARTIALSSRDTAPDSRTLAVFAHEALAGGGDERHRLREEDAHRVAKRDGLLVDPAGRLYLLQRGGRQLDRRAERQGRELLALRLLHGLRLLRRELLDPAQGLLGVAAERESEAAFHGRKLAQLDAVGALDVAEKRVHDLRGALQRNRERGALDRAAQRELELPRRRADRVEPRRCRERWRCAEDPLQLQRRLLRLLDPRRVLGQPERGELRAQLVEIATRRRFLGELAEGEDGDGVANAAALSHRPPFRVEHDPGPEASRRLERAEVGALPRL